MCHQNPIKIPGFHHCQRPPASCDGTVQVITVQRLAKEAVKRAQLARGDTYLGSARWLDGRLHGVEPWKTVGNHSKLRMKQWLEFTLETTMNNYEMAMKNHDLTMKNSENDDVIMEKCDYQESHIDYLMLFHHLELFGV